MSPHSASILQESLALVDQALGVCTQMEADHAALQAKHADTERVYLEKVAAMQKSPLDSRLVDQTLQQLEELSLIDTKSRVKLASQLADDPNQALHLMQRLLSLSAPAHQEGQAIDKSADDHTPPSDQDGWHEVVRKGAA